MSDTLTAQLVAANQNRRSTARERLLNAQSQQVVPQAMTSNAQNSIGLISEGVTGMVNALTAPERRAIEQGNIDAAEAIRLEQQNYERGIAEQARNDKLAAQKLDEIFRRDQLAATQDYNQANLDLQQQRVDATKQQITDEQNQNNVIGDAVVKFDTTQLDPNDRDAGLTLINEYVQNLDATGSEKLAVQDNLIKKYAQGEKQANGKILTKTNPETNKPFTKEEQELRSQATDSYTNSIDTINSINDITVNDISNAGGWSSIGGAWTPDTRASVGKFNQLLGQEFLSGVDTMRGLGALSNAEGAKITAAANALVDPKTNEMRTGLDEEFINEQLSIIKEGYEVGVRKARFIEERGRTPTISELEEITPVLNPSGQPFVVGGQEVTEADIQETMRANDMTRDQVLLMLPRGN